MTLKEIAAMAGVSTATVSYVLNNTAQVSNETRKRVEQIIKETGYRSNILAQSLRKNKSNLVGVIVEDITVWHSAMIIDGINKIAEEQGYSTILNNLRLKSKIETEFEHIIQFEKDIDKALDVLIGMQVDGIIYVGMHDRKMNNVLPEINKPIIYCYCYADGENSSVRYSNKKTIYQITKKLIDLNHKKIAVINGLESSEPAKLRFEGYKKALKDMEIEYNHEYVRVGNWKYDDGKKAARELLNLENRPTAIIAMNDDMALGVYDACKELSINIPKDLSVVGFDYSDIAKFISPQLTTVERPLQEMGNRAMEILLNKIALTTVEDLNIVFPCRLIIGESIGVVKD